MGYLDRIFLCVGGDTLQPIVNAKDAFVQRKKAIQRSNIVKALLSGKKMMGGAGVTVLFVHFQMLGSLPDVIGDVIPEELIQVTKYLYRCI
jgi:hypothetical protein